MSGEAIVLQGNALNLPLPDGSVDLIITSPPYFALRSYRDDGEHYDGQIGSEPTPELFLDALDRAMVEMGRVLKGSGSVFINLGDKYAGGGGQWEKDERPDPGRRRAISGKIATGGKSWGMRAKSLMGLPWRFAIRQIDAGWILRAEIVWSKPNGLPESVTDRVRRSHEQWFHFVKEPRYFSAVDEIREPHRYPDDNRHERGGRRSINPDGTPGGGNTSSTNPLGRLPGSVWNIPTEPLQVPEQFVDHFAAFPQEWPRKLINAWCPEGGVVLDPFGGTGTVAGVARKLGRTGISLDLSMDYARLAEWRIFRSGHFDKTLRRTMADRQGSLL